MPRRKTNPTICPWLSAKPDNKEKRFVQVGNTLLLSPEFQKLGTGARQLYFCMAMESGGKRNFTYPQSAAKKYGFNPATFWRHVDELAKSGFVRVSSGKNLRIANRYEFNTNWKFPSVPLFEG